MTGTPGAPKHLSRRSKAFWRQIAADFMLEAPQFELLRRLCEAIDRADQARDLLSSEGLTTTDRYGQTKPHPAVNIERDARTAIARLLRELNLSAPEETRPPHLAYEG